MSREDLTTIISRALTDADYRKLLLADPDAALEGYNLSESEDQMIRKLDAGAFEELNMDLEERQSKSGFLGGFSLMGSKDTVDASTVLDILTNKYGGS